ncbi:hypothetical protein ASE00_01145 [Sphingomonas sp. Root710]|uniref:thioredoxin domain-containing protein n=1 Tax=Sphingomonas sp. Root710 TaxID=1736594 RepID=UPI0006FF0C01|nr:thioredoxin domain-containing protein [Sphingomonas sp. Root710]KRB85436.1 hypothetical protein ASE00_01145 [Sphingomonas sp. Root710]
MLALAVPTAAMAATPKKAAAKAVPAHANWLTTAHRTAEGAIVIGNPAAKVKMVEYLSLTCSHCADLSASALPPLRRDYIAKGLVSLEVRHAVRDGYDFAASLLLRCAPPAQYLGSIEALFATQSDWMGKGVNVKNVEGFDAMSPDQKMVAAARSAGFDSFFAAQGMSPSAFSACMADAKAKDQLTQMAGNSWQRDKIPGTPFIIINGKRQESVHDWAELEPLIKAALR